MTNFTNYEFGYSWPIVYGPLVPLVVGTLIGALGVWRAWPRWVAVLMGFIALWALTALFIVNVTWGINKPMTLPTPHFLASGAGRVLDAGAGSGRAAVGVLLARPNATVTGLDIYSGYWGIDDNTPARFMENARISGAADRAEARTGDVRKMPFADGEFDAVISSYAIDHLRREGIEQAIAEVSRVLKPRGEFLLMIVNADWATWLVSPPIAHHQHPDPARWRARLAQAGFAVEEEGKAPVTLYFLARKRS